jgi:hypothetical protein
LCFVFCVCVCVCVVFVEEEERRKRRAEKVLKLRDTTPRTKQYTRCTLQNTPHHTTPHHTTPHHTTPHHTTPHHTTPHHTTPHHTTPHHTTPNIASFRALLARWMDFDGVVTRFQKQLKPKPHENSEELLPWYSS